MDTLGRSLEDRHRPPARIPKLELAFEKKWDVIPQELFDNPVFSMRRTNAQESACADDAYHASQSGVIISSTKY